MTTRRVTATFPGADGRPLAKARVRFVLKRGSWTQAGTYPQSVIHVVADNLGRIAVDLWINEEGLLPTIWECYQPSGEVFEFSIPFGLDPITLEELRTLSSPPLPSDPTVGALLSSLIAQHNSDPNAHPGLGGGGPGTGGSNEVTFTQSDLSILSLLPISHGLPTSPSAVAIYDDSGDVIEPDFWRSVAANQIEISLESFAPIVGTWRLSIVN